MTAPIAMQSFDGARSPWELYLVNGLEHGRFAMIFKLHHAIADGQGMVQVIQCFAEISRQGGAALRRSAGAAH